MRKPRKTFRLSARIVPMAGDFLERQAASKGMSVGRTIEALIMEAAGRSGIDEYPSAGSADAVAWATSGTKTPAPSPEAPAEVAA